MLDRWREVPPTAGLPVRARDFVPTRVSFEDGLATFLNVAAAQLECSGTAALIVALTTLKDASARRSVVIPAYTCPLVPLAILHCGLTPVLCDLRRNDFDLSADDLDRVTGDDTLAIIPTHLGGRVADVAMVNRIARAKGAFVIEDAAQSLGAMVNGQPVGSAGDIGFFSLAVGKGLTIYEGGVLVARDQGLRQSLRETSRRMVPYRARWELRRLAELVGYAALYRPIPLRFAYGLPLRRALARRDWIKAVGDDFSPKIPLHRVGAWRRSIGANALSRLPSFLGNLFESASARKQQLRSIRGLQVIDDPAGSRGTWPFLMILMASSAARDNALAELWSARIGVSRLFIHALPDYSYLADRVGSVDMPNARDFASRMLTISNSPWLRDGDFDRICSTLASVAEQR